MISTPINANHRLIFGKLLRLNLDWHNFLGKRILFKLVEHLLPRVYLTFRQGSPRCVNDVLDRSDLVLRGDQNKGSTSDMIGSLGKGNILD